MRLPVDPRRLTAIRDFTTWRAAVERMLSDLDTRLAATGMAGVVVNYTGAGSLPRGMLAANGAVVARADYPRLFARIGTTYNTGGETGAQFRLPNYTTPPAHGSWVILT